MPCNTINRSELDLSKARPDLIRAALEASGFTVTITAGRITACNYDTRAEWAQGEKMQIAGNIENAQKIQQAYSAAAVQYAARQNGWQLKQIAPNKYEAVRR